MKNLLYTLDGEAIVNLTAKPRIKEYPPESGYYTADTTLFRIDLSDPFHRIKLIKSHENAGDCAFFYQLRKVIEERTGKTIDENDDKILEDKIVIIDFEKSFIGRNKVDYTQHYTIEKKGLEGYGYKEFEAIYKPDHDQLVRDFYINSEINITFPKRSCDVSDTEERRFIVFDKSQSMARNSKILLIDAAYLSETCKHYDELDNPLSVSLVDMGSDIKVSSDNKTYKDLEIKDQVELIKLKTKDNEMHLADPVNFNPGRLEIASPREYEEYFIDSIYQYLCKTNKNPLLYLSDYVIKVVLPQSISNFIESGYKKELFKDVAVIDSDDVSDSDSDNHSYADFHCLIIDKDSDHYYYVRKELWDTIDGKTDEEKLDTLKKHYESYKRTVLDRRLNLGLDLHGIKMATSKFYAYRGLYLSTSTRIDDPKLALNKDTVIVLPDKISEDDFDFKSDYYCKKTVKCCTNSYEEKDGKVEAILKRDNDGNVVPTDIDLEINHMFDGEGFIHPDYAKIIKKTKTPNGSTPYRSSNSFQVRMPFIKGILHNVDFKKFINTYSCGSYMIRDYFGEKRDLRKAKIILTESMFKAAEWINEIYGGSENVDPMEIYFEGFKKYEHALYISGSDSSFSHGSITSLNYQILNTLALKKNELHSLIEHHWKYIEDPIRSILDYSEINEDEENIKFDTSITENVTNGNDEQDSSKENNSSFESENPDLGKISEETEIIDENDFSDKWIEVLKTDRNFKDHPYIKNKLNSMKNNRKHDIAFGRLLVPGEIRYLSRDLMLFLRYILDSVYVYEKDTDKKTKIHKNIESLKDHLLKENSFYAPKRQFKDKNGKIYTLGIDFRNEHYPIFRNPHLSRNEECALLYTAESDVRKKYLGHLAGVLMISGESFAHEALGGADFDGDLVKIFDDDKIREAVKRGVYDKKWNRKLPIIFINTEGKKGNKENYSDNINYKIIYDTFSNQVGKISNMAIREGQNIFSSDYNKKASECAEYTILTGLEIDACKTGMHPIIKKKKYKIEYSYLDDFLIPLKKNESNSFYRALPSEKKITIEGKKICFEGSSYEEEYHAEKNDGDEYSTLTELAYVFLYGCKYKKPWKDYVETKPEKTEKTQNFKLKTEITIQEEDVNAATNALFDLKTLKKGLRTRASLVHARKKYGNAIIYILIRKNHDDKLGYVISQTENALRNMIASKNKSQTIEKSKDMLKESEWPYLIGDDEKQRELKKILGSRKNPAPDISLLYDFTMGGYNLLYLFLEYLLADEKEVELENKGCSNSKNLINDCFKRISESCSDPFNTLYMLSRQNKSEVKGLAAEIIWKSYSAETIIESIKKITTYGSNEK